MSSFPNRCQHIKVNGTLCGSPALRRNRFCYFHHRHHEERILLNADSARRRRNNKVTLELPVLEDANSIQVSLMQIMRLLVTGQIDSKTAGLLLYALQTASLNLPRTTFDPGRHQVILDPGAVSETPFGVHIWEDSDFDDDDDDDKEDGQSKRSTRKASAKRPAASVNMNEVRAQVKDVIRKALPDLVTARVDKVNGGRSG